MKITAQRTLVWVVNFALVFALLGFVALMVTNTGKKRRDEVKKEQKALEGALAKVKRPRRSASISGDVDNLKTVLDKNFHFEGYTPPPKVEKIPDNGKKPERAAPPLNTLIQVVFVVAPSRGDRGPNRVEESGAMIKILSIKDAKKASTFWYSEGDVIGGGVDQRADVDATLNDDAFKPCRIVKIISDGIVCDWGTIKKRDMISIKIGEREPSKTISIAGGGHNIGELPTAGTRKKSDLIGVPKDQALFMPIMKNGRQTDDFEFTRAGLREFSDSDSAESVMKEVGTRKVDGGLEVTSLSRRLSSFGLQPGDVIIKVDGRRMSSQSSIVLHVKQKYKSQPNFKVEYLRDGKERSMSVRVPKDVNNTKIPQGVKVGK